MFRQHVISKRLIANISNLGFRRHHQHNTMASVPALGNGSPQGAPSEQPTQFRSPSPAPSNPASSSSGFDQKRKIELWRPVINAMADATTAAFADSPKTPPPTAASAVVQPTPAFRAFWRTVFATRVLSSPDEAGSLGTGAAAVDGQQLTAPASRHFHVHLFAETPDMGCPCCLPDTLPQLVLENQNGVTAGQLARAVGVFMYGREGEQGGAQAAGGGAGGGADPETFLYTLADGDGDSQYCFRHGGEDNPDTYVDAAREKMGFDYRWVDDAASGGRTAVLWTKPEPNVDEATEGDKEGDEAPAVVPVTKGDLLVWDASWMSTGTNEEGERMAYEAWDTPEIWLYCCPGEQFEAKTAKKDEREEQIEEEDEGMEEKID